MLEGHKQIGSKTTALSCPFPRCVVAVLIENVLPRPARVVKNLQLLAGVGPQVFNSVHASPVHFDSSVGAGVAVGNLISHAFSVVQSSFNDFIFVGDLAIDGLAIAKKPTLHEWG